MSCAWHYVQMDEPEQVAQLFLSMPLEATFVTSQVEDLNSYRSS
jgi:hypothetical protein